MTREFVLASDRADHERKVRNRLIFAALVLSYFAGMITSFYMGG